MDEGKTTDAGQETLEAFQEGVKEAAEGQETPSDPTPDPEDAILAALEAGEEVPAPDRGPSDPKEISNPDEEIEEPVASPAPEAKDEAPSPEEPEGDEGAGEESVPADELQAALTALRRYGFSHEDTRGWSQKRILDKGRHLAKIQSDFDSYRSDFDKLKAKVEEGPKGSGQAEPTLGDNLSEIVKPFREQFGDEAGQALEGITKTLNSHFEAALTQQREQAEERMADLQKVTEGLMVESAKARLPERFQEAVKDPQTWATVVEKAKALVGTGAYDDVDQTFLDAAKLTVNWEDVVPEPEEVKEEKAKVDAAKRNGQPTPTSRKTPPRAKTMDEREDAVLDALEAGKGVDAARAAYGA